MRLLAFTFLLLGLPVLALGQRSPPTPAPGVALPADTALSRRLLGSLSGFLGQPAQPAAAPTPYCPTPARPEDAVLLDELRGLDQSRPALPATTYRPQLLGAAALDSGRYLVQLGSLGLTDDGRPVLRATYDLLAYPGSDGRFVFGSPLRLRTRGWRSLRVGGCTFRFAGLPAKAAKVAARAYARQAAGYDQRLDNASQQTEVFCCASLPEALGLAGIAYKADYAGYAHNSLLGRTPQRMLVLYAEGPLAQFDPHDLWHQRLRNVLPAATLNRPVDEGCAYLYGGSWGLAWPTVLAQFKAWAAAHPGRDWLATYGSLTNFGADSHHPMPEAYAINALLVQQVEREKGFAAVRQLLSCGKYEPSNDNYFRVLGQVTGITRENFNARVNELIRASRP